MGLVTTAISRPLVRNHSLLRRHQLGAISLRTAASLQKLEELQTVSVSKSSVGV